MIETSLSYVANKQTNPGKNVTSLAEVIKDRSSNERLFIYNIKQCFVNLLSLLLLRVLVFIADAILHSYPECKMEVKNGSERRKKVK